MSALDDIAPIRGLFEIEGDVIAAEPHGRGHINRTYVLAPMQIDHAAHAKLILLLREDSRSEWAQNNRFAAPGTKL